MTGSFLDWAIIAFIVLSIGIVVWRGGAANPEGTGALGRKVNKLSGRVTTLSQRMGHLESEVAELNLSAATTKDIERIEQLIDERIATLRAENAGQRDLSERTHRSVDRIERMLIERGLGK